MIGTHRQVIKTGTDDTMENRTSRIMGARMAAQGETENVTTKGQENFRMKVIGKEKNDMPGTMVCPAYRSIQMGVIRLGPLGGYGHLPAQKPALLGMRKDTVRLSF